MSFLSLSLLVVASELGEFEKLEQAVSYIASKVCGVVLKRLAAVHQF